MHGSKRKKHLMRKKDLRLKSYKTYSNIKNTYTNKKVDKNDILIKFLEVSFKLKVELNRDL